MGWNQMNGDMYYPSLGRSMNQIQYLDQIGAFRQDIGNINTFLKSYPIDDESVDLELRIRSYFDANCSSCHRPGGVPMVNLDFRFVVPLKLQNIINVQTAGGHICRHQNLQTDVKNMVMYHSFYAN